MELMTRSRPGRKHVTKLFCPAESRMGFSACVFFPSTFSMGLSARYDGSLSENLGASKLLHEPSPDWMAGSRR